MNTKLKIIVSMLKWLLSPHYVHLRLSTMYGSRYYIYIARHPIRFVQDINHYINWCIEMDKLKWTLYRSTYKLYSRCYSPWMNAISPKNHILCSHLLALYLLIPYTTITRILLICFLLLITLYSPIPYTISIKLIILLFTASQTPHLNIVL